MKLHRRICEICGAQCKNINRKVTTCSPTCTRAKHNGFTRIEQEKRDIEDEMEREQLNCNLNQRLNLL